MDWLADETESQEHLLGVEQERQHRERLLAQAMLHLNEREREIIAARRMSDPPVTLDDLSQKFGISRERVRQLEVRAFEKLQESIQKAAVKEGLIIEGKEKREPRT
jgi:RNA polymerase sigma-32 factor